jgi:hypothetical protein
MSAVASSKRSSKVIDAKAAVQLALAYCVDLFPQSKNAELALEELEESYDGAKWIVTLGFNSEVNFINRPLFEIALKKIKFERIYKTFTIDNKKGRVVSVKIRQVA